MSRTEPTDVERRMLARVCPDCGAVGWCRSVSGRWASHLHAARYYAWLITKETRGA